MASRYTTTLGVPDAFPPLLKDFAREVLRHQPVNIYEFGARYFAKLARGRRTPTLVDARAMSAVELKEYLLNLFLDHDPKHTGRVDYRTFGRIVRGEARLELTPKQQVAVLAEADEDAAGAVMYRALCEEVARVLARLYRTEGDTLEEDVDPATVLFVHGYLRKEADDELRGSLSALDPDATGTVARADLRRFLRTSVLGFSRRELNVILAELKEDIHARFEIEAFVQRAFDHLVMASLREATLKQRTPAAWTQYLTDMFAAADPRSVGTLHHTRLRLLIRDADLALSDLQIYAMMAECDEDMNGEVDYAAAAPVLGDILHALFSIPLAERRNAAVKTIAVRRADTFVHGMERDVFSGRLRAALSEHDKTGSGIMNRYDVRVCLEGAGLELDTREINALMSVLDEDGNGRVDYCVLLPLAYNVMVHVARMQLIREITREGGAPGQ